MKSVLEKLLAFAGRHLPDVLALFVAILFFLVVSGYFISEKGAVEKLFATGAGFAGGMLGGGIIGWVVGGIGVAAMGTAVGVGAIGAIVVGSLAGAVLGGLTGMSFSFIQLIRKPIDYNVNWLAVLLMLFGSALIFVGVRWLLQKVPSVARRFSPPRSNTSAD